MDVTRRSCLAVIGGLFLPAVARASTRDMELGVHRAINVQRGIYGLPPLVWSEAIAYTARQHSARMLTAGFFAHRDPLYGDFSERISASGMRWSHVAENIFKAKGYPDMVAMSVDRVDVQPRPSPQHLERRVLRNGSGRRDLGGWGVLHHAAVFTAAGRERSSALMKKARQSH